MVIVRSLCVAASSMKSTTMPASLRGGAQDAADPLLIDPPARRRRRCMRMVARGEFQPRPGAVR